MIRRTTIEPYGSELVLVTTQAALDRVCRSLSDEWPVWESEGLCAEFSGEGPGGRSRHVLVVAIDERRLLDPDSEPCDAAQLIAHEATHAAGLLLDHIGQPYDGASEAHAYLVGWIVRWVWQQTHRLVP